MKAKARKALEDETLKQVYALRKIEVETVFGNLKGNLAFRRFLLRGLDKVHVEFGILAMAHNFLKVAGILRMLSAKKHKKQKQAEKKQLVFLRLLYFRDLLDSPCSMMKIKCQDRIARYPSMLTG